MQHVYIVVCLLLRQQKYFTVENFQSMVIVRHCVQGSIWFRKPRALGFSKFKLSSHACVYVALSSFCYNNRNILLWKISQSIVIVRSWLQETKGPRFFLKFEVSSHTCVCSLVLTTVHRHIHTIFHDFQALVEHFFCLCLQLSGCCICKKQGGSLVPRLSCVGRENTWAWYTPFAHGSKLPEVSHREYNHAVWPFSRWAENERNFSEAE